MTHVREIKVDPGRRNFRLVQKSDVIQASFPKINYKNLPIRRFVSSNKKKKTLKLKFDQTLLT